MIRYRKFVSCMVLLLPLLGLEACGPKHSVVHNDRGVVFLLDYPDATEVIFASSADDFRLQKARRDKQGRWFVDGMKPEDFEYFYLVDGKFFVPDCRYRQQDDFGNDNCIYQP